MSWGKFKNRAFTEFKRFSSYYPHPIQRMPNQRRIREASYPSFAAAVYYLVFLERMRESQQRTIQTMRYSPYPSGEALRYLRVKNRLEELSGSAMGPTGTGNPVVEANVALIQGSELSGQVLASTRASQPVDFDDTESVIFALDAALHETEKPSRNPLKRFGWSTFLTLVVDMALKLARDIRHTNGHPRT